MDHFDREFEHTVDLGADKSNVMYTSHQSSGEGQRRCWHATEAMQVPSSGPTIHIIFSLDGGLLCLSSIIKFPMVLCGYKYNDKCL